MEHRQGCSTTCTPWVQSPPTTDLPTASTTRGGRPAQVQPPTAQAHATGNGPTQSQGERPGRRRRRAGAQ
eukprot:2544983-Lingulodinium_polyedra.AAC.1